MKLKRYFVKDVKVTPGGYEGYGNVGDLYFQTTKAKPRKIGQCVDDGNGGMPCIGHISKEDYEDFREWCEAQPPIETDFSAPLELYPEFYVALEFEEFMREQVTQK